MNPQIAVSFFFFENLNEMHSIILLTTNGM